MKFSKSRWILFGGSIVFLVLCFQNCAQQGFVVKDGLQAGNGDLGSTDLGTDPAHIMPLSILMEANKDLEFSVHSDSQLSSASFQWSHSLNGATGVCAEKSFANSTNYIINCPMTGSLSVSVLVTEGNSSQSLPVYVAQVGAESAPVNQIPMKVDFVIAAGTGQSPWNSPMTLVETFVGQTLSLQNRDSIVHQLHTAGKPFSHGAGLAPGATANYSIGVAYSASSDGIIYDHLVGPSAAFYLVAYDGAVLYSQNCASCHGALSSSEKKGSRVSEIKNAFQNIPAMKSNANLMKLSQRQIEAISYALGGR